jgi:cyclohexa-1,5-dienecarbonyl-CoA hydratase
MNASPLVIQTDRDERLLRLTLARPKANIIDAEMIAALQTALDEHSNRAELAAVLLSAEGPNFSFGASVEEHLPEQCEQMLKSFHRLIVSMLDYPVPILVAVRGFCFGGGMEVACAGSLMFATSDANFGQPEIQLGVFAPAASCLLPERIGRAQAEDLLLSGRSIQADEALRIGLINAIADDPDTAAIDYFDKQIAPRSSCALRHALRSARFDLVARVKEKLAAVEQCYLQDLMSSHDAVEGLNAFIEKRPAVWKHK